ncbi:MAG: aminopeptidase, partial [Clostridia bacterium]|nr:aminopeptidase [Clostridia bacterium]
MKKSLIRKYARTVAVVGGNVQKGQSVIVCVEPENEDFGVMLAEECYKAGAGCVAVEFYSNKVTKVDVRYRTLKSLETVPKWGEAKAQQEVDDCAVRILVESDDPNALKGVNVAKMRKAHNARRAVMKKYSDALEGRQQW